MRPICTLLTLLFLYLSASEAKTLTWKETLTLAQEHNLEYQAALASYKSVADLELSGLSGFLPKINATATSSHSSSQNNSSSQSYSAQLSLSQNLFAGFADIHNYYLKKTTTQQALANLNSAKAKLSQEIKQNYAEVLYIQDYKKLVHDILNRRTENNLNVKLQYEVGRENKGSLLLAQSYIDQADFDVLKTTHDEDLYKENLKRLLGLSPEESVILTDSIPKEDVPKSNPDFNLIASQHPDILNAILEETIALYNYKISRSQFLPTLDLTSSYGYSGDHFFPDQNKWNIGLTLSIPLFEGFKTISSYKSTGSKFEALRLTSLNTRLKITSTIKQTFYEYLQSIQKEKNDASFVKAAMLRAEIARNKYKNGLLNFEDWDLIETDLIQRQKEMLNSQKNRIIKHSLWERAQGIGVF